MATYCSTPFAGGAHFNILDTPISGILNGSNDISHAFLLSAVSKPDDCHRDEAYSRNLNVERMKMLISDLLNRGVTPVFFSTESVFDGAQGNYVETDSPRPLMAYGRQKLEIESFLRAQSDNHIIIRLGRVFGSRRGDGTLFTAWLEQLEKDQNIRCATDNIFSPIHIADAAESLRLLVQQNLTGTYHLAGPDALSRYDMLETLVREYTRHRPYRGRIVPCKMRDFATPEPRPLDISLNPGKIIEATGFQIRGAVDWIGRITNEWCLDA